MLSSVVESYSSSPIEAQGQEYQPHYDPRMSDFRGSQPKQRPGEQKRSLVLAPAEGWFALVLLAIAVYCVVFSISAVGWASNTFILNWSATAGLALGLIVAKMRRLPQAILHLAACLIGHWLSVWLTSAFAFHVPWTVLIAGIGAVISDPTNINHSEMVFLFYLSFLSFFLGYFGTWLIYHAHLPWLVAVVYCSILLINLSYVPHDLSVVLAILVTALILLIARTQLSAKLVQWRSEGLYSDRIWLRDITSRFIRFASMLVVCMLLISWMLPILGQPTAGVTFWNYLDNAWANTLQGHFSWQDPGSMLQPYQAPTNFFGDELTISGSVHLPTGEVLYYTSTAAPQYLAGFTYDHFDGHTWTSLSSVNSQAYDANMPLPNDETSLYTSAKTLVTLVQPPEGTKHYLFGPTQPAAFDVSTMIYGSPMISAWAQQSALTRGEHYQVISTIPTVTPENLASIPLPQGDTSAVWKQDTNYSTLQAYYSQVPTNLSPQVEKTLLQWTHGATNTYEALKMLEGHLSDATQFTYSLDNSIVPANVDAVSWLLQTHRGYCTYYATAMTIMTRLLGIPARIINGFNHGHFDAQRKVWVVDGTDAHSWVQAYFPSFGWISFDPTPGYALNVTSSPKPTTTPVATATAQPTRPPLKGTPPAKKKMQPPLRVSPSGSSGIADTGVPENIFLGISIAALCCSLLIFLLAIARYWWRSLYANSTFIAATFWRLCRIASWVGLAPRRWQTPYEYSRILCQRLPQEASLLWRLTELFVRERWAPPSQTYSTLTHAELERFWPGLRRMFVRLLWMRTQRQ
ncbi:MAG: hypothetical protein NVS4B7_04980 [Ktedonobacteraceae bacterium]